MRPARAMRLYAARFAHEADMFPVAVTPSDAACASARANAESCRSIDGAGMAAPIRSSALSLKMPIGSPRASRGISPPTGARVALVIIAARIAAAFANAMCPSRRDRKTGLCGVTESIQSWCGNGAPRHNVWARPRPVERPVHTGPPSMTMSALDPHAVSSASATTHDVRRTKYLLAELGDPANCVERGEWIAGWIGWWLVLRLAQAVANIEQDFE